MVQIVDRENDTAITTTATFRAYTGPVTHIRFLSNLNLLATVGDDDALHPSTLRLWDIAKGMESYRMRPAAQQASWRPPYWQHLIFSGQHSPPPGARPVGSYRRDEPRGNLCSSPKATEGHRPPAHEVPNTVVRSVVTFFDISEDLQRAAFALVSGECVLLVGDLAKERSVRVQRIRSSVAQGSLSHVFLPSPTHVCINGTGGPGGTTPSPVSHLSYVLSAWRDDHRVMPALFTVYNDTVTVWGISQSGTCIEYRTPFTFGAAVHHAALHEDGRLMVCGACRQVGLLSKAAAETVMDPTRLDTVTYKVHTLDVTLTTRRALTFGDYVAVLCEDENDPDCFTLQCYDLSNHIRALSRTQDSYKTVRDLLVDRKRLTVLTEAGPAPSQSYQLTTLTEAPVLVKLKLLLQKECYATAKALADQQAEHLDPTLTVHIQQRYADHLYTKGRYAEAMEQYIATIGHVEPSYVIGRYIHTYLLGDLSRYLEHLHQTTQRRYAHPSHTTLLLSCYVKLKDLNSLMSFVQRDDVRFDPEHAINVCREGGFFEAALCVSERYALHGPHVRTLLYDCQKPRVAMAYIRTLCVDAAESIIIEVGKKLVAWDPLRATELILELSVRWQGPARRLSSCVLPPDTPQLSVRANATAFLAVFVDSPVCLLNYLRGVVASGVLEASPDPSEHFILYHTLLELYITSDLRQSIRMADEEPPMDDDDTCVEVCGYEVEATEDRRTQALTLLEAYQGHYDDYYALSICYQHDFKEGVLFLLQHLALHAESMPFYVDGVDSAATPSERDEAVSHLLRLCVSPKASSEMETQALWLRLLSLLVNKADEHPDELQRVLGAIDSCNALSPVTVMEMVAASEGSVLRLGDVRAYYQRALRQREDKKRHFQQEATEHRGDAEELEKRVNALRTSGVLFPCRGCAQCAEALDFPTVHFLCGHSFHQRCLDRLPECPLCDFSRQRKSQHGSQAVASGAEILPTETNGRTGADGPSLAPYTDWIRKGALNVGVPLRPEAHLFGKDSYIPSSCSETSARVWTDGGDLLRPEDVELW